MGRTPLALFSTSLLLTLPAAAQCEVAKLGASDGFTPDFFGNAVAVDGSTALVGAGFDLGSGGSGAGATYVFELLAGGWTETVQLTGTGDPDGDSFGAAVDLEGDRALIGAPAHDAAGDGAGAAFVFERTAGAWGQVAMLTASSAAAEDGFGACLDLDGDRAIVFGGDTAYVFERQAGGAWIEVAELIPDDGLPMGRSVAISGGTAAVGAESDHSIGPSVHGAVYVFDEGPGGWSQSQKLLPTAPSGLDQFGRAVALDGDRLFVGRPGFAVTDSGQVHAFERSAGTWTETQTLLPGGGSVGASFGTSMDLDGARLLVGAPTDLIPAGSAGGAYLFQDDGSSWSQVDRLDASGLAVNDQYGSSVALQGSNAVVGGPGIILFGSKPGSAWFYDTACLQLLAAPASVSISTGGTQAMTVTSDLTAAGSPYLIVGGLSGTSPGFPLGGTTIPINVDTYTVSALNSPNAFPWSGFFGLMDPVGSAAASVTVPTGLSPSLAGSVFHHVVVLFQVGPLAVSVSRISNTATLTLVP